MTTISNCTDGSPTSDEHDDNVHTRYAYTNGLQTHLWTDVAGDDDDGVPPLGANRQSPADDKDQVTVYTYGVSAAQSPGPSLVASGGLLRSVMYPDLEAGETDADRTVTFGYNAQGEVIYTKDQAGNVREHDYDTAGRLVHLRLTTIAPGFDSTVRRVSYTFTGLGQLLTATQYDNAVVGLATALDEVKYTYDGWGLTQRIEQDRDSAVTPGGNHYYVFFTTAKKAGVSHRDTLRRTAVNYSGLGQVTYDYSVGAFNDAFSRVGRVSWKPGTGLFPVPMAAYEYLGADRLVGTDLLPPDVRWQHFENGSGSGDAKYPDLDRFGRIVKSRWTSYKGTGPKDFYSDTIAYDENSNITSVDDAVHAGKGGKGLWDAQYAVDALNRLTRAKGGHLGGGAVSDLDATRDERWTLSQSGNWNLHRLDLDGDLNYNEAGELTDRGTFNLANELQSRDTDDSSPVEFTLSHDKAGNLTGDGKYYTYKYDALYRLKEVRKASGGALVAEYVYNALDQQIGRHTDANGDGATDAGDPWFYSLYDDRWREVAVYRGADSLPKRQYVYHAAGRDGLGGSDYIDRVLLRERDTNGGGGILGQSDGTLEERVFFCQNQHADVVAVLSSGGTLIESVRYSPFGVPFGMPGGDTDSDGDYDAADQAAITGAYDVRKDVDLDGDVDASDAAAAGVVGQNLGWGVLSKTKTGDNTRGYAGYRHEPGLSGTVYHVRHRTYWADQGRFLQRDPAGFVAGINLYSYVVNRPLQFADPMGLFGCSAGSPCAGVPPATPPGYIQPSPVIPPEGPPSLVPGNPTAPSPGPGIAPGQPVTPTPSCPTTKPAPKPGILSRCWTAARTGTGMVVRCCTSTIGAVAVTFCFATPIGEYEPPPEPDPTEEERNEWCELAKEEVASECAGLTDCTLNNDGKFRKPCTEYSKKAFAWMRCESALRAAERWCKPPFSYAGLTSQSAMLSGDFCFRMFHACQEDGDDDDRDDDDAPKPRPRAPEEELVPSGGGSRTSM